MDVIIINKKEAKILKDSKKGYMIGFGGRKGKGRMI